MVSEAGQYGQPGTGGPNKYQVSFVSSSSYSSAFAPFLLFFLSSSCWSQSSSFPSASLSSSSSSPFLPIPLASPLPLSLPLPLPLPLPLLSLFLFLSASPSSSPAIFSSSPSSVPLSCLLFLLLSFSDCVRTACKSICYFGCPHKRYRCAANCQRQTTIFNTIQMVNDAIKLTHIPNPCILVSTTSFITTCSSLRWDTQTENSDRPTVVCHCQNCIETVRTVQANADHERYCSLGSSPDSPICMPLATEYCQA